MKQRIAAMLIFAAVLLAASAWPSEGRAQTRIARVGIITVGAATDEAMAGYRFDLIRRAFASQGWSEGRTIAFELRNARGDASRFAEIAAELVRLKVDLIWADSAPALRATYAATRTVPIVAMDFTTDPVAAGYAQSYGRPGGNMTGVFLDAPEFSGKWLELLKAMVPGLSRVAVLWDPSPGDAHLRGVQAAAPSFGVQLQVLEVRKPEEIDAIGSAFPGRPQALIVLPSPMTLAESPRLARLAAKQRLPATSIFRLFAEEGGAVAYGPEAAAVVERGAVQATRILRGAKPGDLPIERPTKFELVVNLKAARALNLTIPESVLARADRVIR
jgi:putative ABC transport system substrate-binding protein